MLAYDHVSAPTRRRSTGWTVRTTSTPRSTSRSCCSASSPASPRLELVTGILILPQRQTALVAKQAAEVDLLTGGRFRLGVGIGGTRSSTRRSARTSARGRRIESRSSCCAGSGPSGRHLRGPYRPVTGAGIAPLPVQRPIPVWIGASRPALPAGRTAGRRWFPPDVPGPETAGGPGQVGGRRRRRRAVIPGPRHRGPDE